MDAQVAVEDEKLRKVYKPQCTAEKAVELAKQYFGVEQAQDVKELDSYDDRNFYMRARLSGEDMQVVFKIHNGADSRPERRSLLEAQNAILLHLSSDGVKAPVPLKSVSGEHICYTTMPIRNGSDAVHGLRLLTFVVGPLMSQVEHTSHLLAELGRAVASMSLSLARFDHAGAHRQHLWDLQNFPCLKSFLPAVTDPDRKALVEKVFNMFDRDVVPVLGELPRQVAQNDANDHNIVVSEDGKRVVGIIDFGDMVHTLRVNELAITIAYALLDKEDLHQTAQCIVRAYMGLAELTAAEQQLLHTLTCSRLAQSVIMSAYSYSQDPTNEYLLVTSRPGWVALSKLLAMSEKDVAAFNLQSS